MSHKAKILLVIIISCCALFSVGFANWAILEDNPSMDSEVNSGTENILYSKDYIKLNDEEGSENPRWFKYTYRGFRNGDDISDISYKGSLTAEYIINLEKCKEIYSANKNITVEFSIGLKNNTQNNVFASEGYVTAEINSADLKIDFDSQSGNKFSNNVMYSTFTLDLNSQTTTATQAKIAVTYTFDFDNFADYSRYIYNELNGMNQQFEFNAKLLERA